MSMPEIGLIANSLYDKLKIGKEEQESCRWDPLNQRTLIRLR